MEGEYSQEWAELRKLRRRMFRVAGAGGALPRCSARCLCVAQYGQNNRAWSSCRLGRLAAEVLLPIIRIRVLVMPQMRRTFSLCNEVVRQMEQSVRSALCSLWFAQVGGFRP